MKKSTNSLNRAFEFASRLFKAGLITKGEMFAMRLAYDSKRVWT